MMSIRTQIASEKKTEFYERLEEKQANQSEIKDGFSFLDKETYDKLPLTRWLDKSGHPLPGHLDLPVETAAEIKVLARGEPFPLDLLVRSNLVQQELTRLGVNSIALLNRTVHVAPDVMGKLRDLLDREVDMHDREWMETMQRLTVTEKKREEASVHSQARFSTGLQVDSQPAGELNAEGGLVENFVH